MIPAWNRPEALRNVLVKSLTPATPRLQCLMMRILPCDFSVKYIKGSTTQLANCLFRLQCLDDQIKFPVVQVHSTASKIQLFNKATAQDDHLCLLKHIGQADWPGQIEKVPSEKQPYWNFCRAITREDWLLLKGTRTTIPTSQRQALFRQLNAGHLGLEKH